MATNKHKRGNHSLFGPPAKEAMPALLLLLEDQATGSPTIMRWGPGQVPLSRAVAGALLKIDPETAAKAGMKSSEVA